jgi:outer membrane lipoprotein-sorting protein
MRNLSIRWSLVLGVVAALALLATPGAYAQWTLKDALKQIDTAMADFSTATADVVVKIEKGGDTRAEVESGKVWVRSDGQFRADLLEPDPRILIVASGTAYNYDPTKFTVEIYALGKHPEVLAQYALLGFSEYGSALKKDFLVTLLEESSLEDRKVLVLELTPKNEKLRQQLSSIRLWIDQSNWLPVQQRMHHGDADSNLTVTYKDFSRNVPIDSAQFKPKWPKGTKKVKK